MPNSEKHTNASPSRSPNSDEKQAPQEATHTRRAEGKEGKKHRHSHRRKVEQQGPQPMLTSGPIAPCHDSSYSIHTANSQPHSRSSNSSASGDKGDVSPSFPPQHPMPENEQPANAESQVRSPRAIITNPLLSPSHPSRHQQVSRAHSQASMISNTRAVQTGDSAGTLSTQNASTDSLPLIGLLKHHSMSMVLGRGAVVSPSNEYAPGTPVLFSQPLSQRRETHLQSKQALGTVVLAASAVALGCSLVPLVLDASCSQQSSVCRALAIVFNALAVLACGLCVAGAFSMRRDTQRLERAADAYTRTAFESEQDVSKVDLDDACDEATPQDSSERNEAEGELAIAELCKIRDRGIAAIALHMRLLHVENIITRAYATEIDHTMVHKYLSFGVPLDTTTTDRELREVFEDYVASLMYAPPRRGGAISPMGSVDTPLEDSGCSAERSLASPGANSSNAVSSSRNSCSAHAPLAMSTGDTESTVGVAWTQPPCVVMRIFCIDPLSFMSRDCARHIMDRMRVEIVSEFSEFIMPLVSDIVHENDGIVEQICTSTRTGLPCALVSFNCRHPEKGSLYRPDDEQLEDSTTTGCNNACAAAAAIMDTICSKNYAHDLDNSTDSRSMSSEAVFSAFLSEGVGKSVRICIASGNVYENMTSREPHICRRMFGIPVSLVQDYMAPLLEEVHTNVHVLVSEAVAQSSSTYCCQLVDVCLLPLNSSDSDVICAFPYHPQRNAMHVSTPAAFFQLNNFMTRSKTMDSQTNVLINALICGKLDHAKQLLRYLRDISASLLPINREKAAAAAQAAGGTITYVLDRFPAEHLYNQVMKGETSETLMKIPRLFHTAWKLPAPAA